MGWSNFKGQEIVKAEASHLRKRRGAANTIEYKMLWEVISYHPKLFFTLEATAKHYQQKLIIDTNYFHELLRKWYKKQNASELTYDQCRRELGRSIGRSWIVTIKMSEIVIYYIGSNQEKSRLMPKLLYGANHIFLTHTKLFVWGGYGSETKWAFVYDLYNGKLYKRQNMLDRREYHAIARFNEKIYAFGGMSANEELDTVEQLFFQENIWYYASDLPFYVQSPFAVNHKDQIFIVGENTDRLISFKPRNDLFTIINTGRQLSSTKILISSGNILFIIHSEMTVVAYEPHGWEVVSQEVPPFGHGVGEALKVGNYIYQMTDQYQVLKVHAGTGQVKLLEM